MYYIVRYVRGLVGKRGKIVGKSLNKDDRYFQNVVSNIFLEDRSPTARLSDTLFAFIVRAIQFLSWQTRQVLIRRVFAYRYKLIHLIVHLIVSRICIHLVCQRNSLNIKNILSSVSQHCLHRETANQVNELNSYRYIIDQRFLWFDENTIQRRNRKRRLTGNWWL